MRGWNWRFCIILVGAAILRLLSIQSRGIQYDDAFSIFLSQQPLKAIIAGTAADTMPPLYYFLLHTWGQAGWEIWWLRILSILLSLGGVWLIFLITRRLAGEEAGLFAVILAGISPLQIYHAQDLRMYALTTFLVMGYFWFFLRIWQDKGKTKFSNWIGVILCSAGALYSHNLAGFLLLFPYIFLLVRKEWIEIFKLAGGHLVSLILFLPWITLLPGQVEKIQKAFWTPQPGIVEVVQAGILSAANLPLPVKWLIPVSVVSLGALSLVGLEMWRNRKQIGNLAILAWCAVIPGLILFALSYIMRPLYVPRAFLAGYLALDGLAGWAIWQGWQKGGGKILLGLFVAASVLTLPYQVTFDKFPRSPFQEAMKDLAGEMMPGDLLLYDNKLSFFPAKYYAPTMNQKFLMDEPGSANDTYAAVSQQVIGLIPEMSMETATSGATRVIFIVFETTEKDYQDIGYPQHPGLLWLEERGALEKVETWNDLKAYFYQLGQGK